MGVYGTPQTRGTLLDPDDESTVNLGVIQRERTTLDAGLFTQALPLTTSNLSLSAAIYGRQRVIIVEGIFSGTQAQIESFIEDIDDWINTGGTTETRYYFPRHHPDNTGAAQSAGTQAGYYGVLGINFEYDWDVNENPNFIKYTLVLREGTRVL